MSNGPRLATVLRHLRKVIDPPGTGGVDDAALVERVVRRRDEAAFVVLVWRHERLVMSVCQRILRDEHDAEDAFQATFLTLVRKARSISKRAAMAGWLYTVAYRIALRAGASKRASRE